MSSSAVRKSAEARIGTLLDGKWTLDKLLGYGGSAAVYAATHRNGKRAAVKVLHAHCAADPDLVARFVREGYLANKIEHPGVVSVLDDDRADDGTVYLVMELLDGRSFERQVRGAAPPLSIAEALHIADDLLDILVKAHAVGLVHRDIKPANIFLTAAGQLKILDFGIARLAEQFSTEGVTQTGMLMGTPAYMPPEQARGRWQEVDARSDIWAVGVTLASLMTGKRPRTADTPAEELLAAMMQPMPSLATTLPDAPPSVVALIDKAIAFERADRWQSASEMQHAVRTTRLALHGSEPMPSSMMTVALARDGHSNHPTAERDPTPPPTGQQGVFYGSTLLQPPPPRPNLSLAQEPEPLPSHTTHGAMMVSGFPYPPKTSARVGIFIAVATCLGVLGLGAVGVTVVKRSKVATAEAAPTAQPAAPTAQPAAPAAQPTAPPTPVAVATPPPVVEETPDAGVVAVPPEQRKKDPKRPKPGAKPGDGAVDPSKFFDSRN